MEPYIIDIHAHPFCEEDLATYRAKAKGRLQRTILLHYKEDMEGRPFSMDELLRYVESHEGLSMVGSVRSDMPIKDQVAYLEPLLKAGRIVGVKFYPGYEYFHADDKDIVYPVAELCRRFGKPIIFHAGDVWDPEGTSLLMYSYAVSLHVDRLARDFPDLKIVIAHFNFPKFMDCANVVSKRANVYTDISGTIDKQDTAEDLQRLTDRYVAELTRIFDYFPNIKRKVMFGTDYCGESISLNQFEPYVEVVKKVFTPEEQKRVFHKTAEKVFFS